MLEAGGRRLTCLPAPGHTPGQLCFWDEADGILFTGDHVLFDISPNITPWNGMEDALGCYLDSLRAVRELPARLALPGHRRPGALAPRVDALLEHHARRLDELTAILRARPGSTAYEAAAHMTWNIRSRSWDDFPLAQKWFAVGECVGLGTFRPVKVDDVESHHMHSEFYIVEEDQAKLINDTKKAGKRVISVGTTSCRTLESATGEDGILRSGSGWTEIFIYPGYKFKMIDGLITNFHLPESTLLMLVSALAGKENIMRAYETAVQERYRFFSFGDAMIII